MSDDQGYQTIPALMLKETPYAEFLHGENDIFALTDALAMLDALEEVITVWKDGMDAFGLTTQDDCASSAYGAIMVARLVFNDLKSALPETPRKEADAILRNLSSSFLPLARSYAQTPMLAQWYVSLPLRVSETYNRLRGQR